MSTAFRFVTPIVVLMVVGPWCDRTQAENVVSPVASPVIEQAQKQQDGVQSAIFKIHGHEIINRSSADPHLGGKRPTKATISNDGKGTSVSADFDVEISFLGMDGCCRVENNRPVFGRVRKLLDANKRTAVFDGNEQSRSLDVRESRVNKGFIFPAEVANPDIETVAYRPLCIAFRPFVKKFMGEFTLDAYLNDAVKQGNSIRLKSPRRELWFDINNENALRRYAVQTSRNKPYAAVEVTKTEISENFWVPKEWTTTYFDIDGTPKAQIDYQVVEYYLNPPLTRADFELEFGPDTLVMKQFSVGDLSPKDEYWYIDKAGNRTDLSREQYNVFGADGSGVLPSIKSTNQSRKTWIWINAVVFFVLVGAVIWHRMAKDNPRSR